MSDGKTVPPASVKVKTKLPATGSSTGAFLLLAGILLFLGIVMVNYRRRSVA